MQNLFQECSVKYFRALCDPWNAEVSCVPAAINVPTLKVKRNVKGTFTTGTNGTGWVVMAPAQSVFNNTTDIYATSAAYTGTVSSVPYASDTGVIPFNIASDYSTTIAEDVLTCRVVAAGLRIKNRTPLMARGCSVYGYESTTHATLLSTVSNTDPNVQNFNQVLADDYSVEVNSDEGDWSSVTWHPLNVNDVSMLSPMAITQFSNSVNVPGNSTLGFYISSTGGAQTFAFEAVVHYEVAGERVGGETPTYSDPQGLSLINNIMQLTPLRLAMTGERMTKIKRILSTIGKYAPEVARYAHALSKVV